MSENKKVLLSHKLKSTVFKNDSEVREMNRCKVFNNIPYTHCMQEFCTADIDNSNIAFIDKEKPKRWEKCIFFQFIVIVLILNIFVQASFAFFNANPQIIL